MAVQKQDDQPELTYSSYVRTRDVTQKTCRRRRMIGRSGERGSGISVLAGRHDDDDDDIYMCVCEFVCVCVCFCVCVCVCVHIFNCVSLCLLIYVCV